MLTVQIEKRLGDFTLGARFESAGGITAVFGPSGAGKTTLVNAIAGLIAPDRGRIAIDGTVLFDSERRINLPPHRREIGYIFQEGRLFPHLSVSRNLDYGRRMRGLPADTKQLERIVDLLDIGHLLERRPGKLSGGERQRVAIGRALLTRPHLLLLDEPLASLDAARKDEIMPYLIRLKQALKLPIIYVTHALDEVSRLGDSLVLVEAGRVVGYGALPEIAARADLPQAQRDDAGALLLCHVVEHDSARDLSRLEGGGAMFWVPLLDAPLGAER